MPPPFLPMHLPAIVTSFLGLPSAQDTFTLHIMGSLRPVITCALSPSLNGQPPPQHYLRNSSLLLLWVTQGPVPLSFPRRLSLSTTLGYTAFVPMKSHRNPPSTIQLGSQHPLRSILQISLPNKWLCYNTPQLHRISLRELSPLYRLEIMKPTVTTCTHSSPALMTPGRLTDKTIKPRTSEFAELPDESCNSRSEENFISKRKFENLASSFET